jgi:hypothetical protein
VAAGPDDGLSPTTFRSPTAALVAWELTRRWLSNHPPGGGHRSTRAHDLRFVEYKYTAVYFHHFRLLVQLASAAIFHDIRAKRSQVQDRTHAVLKTKRKKNSAAHTEPTLRTK